MTTTLYKQVIVKIS